MKQPLLIAGLMLLFLGSVTSCTQDDSLDRPDFPLDRIRRGNIEPPATLDPGLADDIHAFNILLDLYEGLIAEDATGNLVPGVAESWSVSADGLLYTFRLRNNALWSDGTPVVAADFVNGLRRIASPDTTSSYAFLLESIVGFSDVQNGRAEETGLGVRAADDSILEIRLSRPSPHFLGVLAMPIAFPLYGGAHDSSRFRDATHFVGNGAYVLERYDAGRTVHLRRNPSYWDGNSVTVESIEYVPIVDEYAEFNMYRSGELDITATIPPNQIPLALEAMPDEVHIAPSLALYYFAFDLTEPPLDSLDLRRALTMAINRQQLVELLGRGEQPAFGIVPPGVANYQGATYPWQDLGNEDRADEARRAFESAGYGPDNPLRLKLTYDVDGVHEKIALAVSSMWQDVLQVEIELEKKGWQHFLDTRDDRSAWQVMRFSWFGDYNDAATFTDIFHSTSLQNLPRFKSPEYDEALDQASLEVDPGKRALLMREAENLLLESYPIAPLYFYVNKHMVKPHIGGFEDTILDRHPSKYLSIQQTSGEH